MTVTTSSSANAIAPGYEETERFATVEQEHAAIHGSAAVVDRSARLRLLFAGAQAAEALTGLVTNDVLSLRPGAGQFAAALTAKGKVIADVRIFARADDLLVDVSQPAGPGFAAMARKYVNPRLAKFADVSSVLRTVGVFGPRAHTLLAGALSADADALAVLEPYQHVTLTLNGTHILAASVPDLGVEGYDLFAPVESALVLWTRLVSAGAVPTGRAAEDIARVEAGRPRWGTDMDESTLAAEANFDALAGISYTKGCYTGQETVARLHFRGHANRFLRGLRSAEPIPRGAQLFAADGQPCGDVRSSVVSPHLGPIAIAMIRREVAEGSDVTARWDGGNGIASVRGLPFS